MIDAHLRIDPYSGSHDIEKHVYGHFIEHHGRCISDGLWVGEKSHIPNKRGIRDDVVRALKTINAPNVRWPGGCYAEEYHWIDGIGPKHKRPKKLNSNWGGIEDHAFGTHEFMDFCEIAGCEPYFCGNVASGSQQEMRDWIEYLNGRDQSDLVAMRKANGRDAPWNVRLWAVGNESWGYGGNMTPEYYADLFRRFTNFAWNFSEERLFLVGCGPMAQWPDVDRNHEFFERNAQKVFLGLNPL